MSEKIKIIVADDDGLIRDSLKLLIDLEDDMEVIATATNGEDAFSLCREFSPDLVLMDIRMPILDGVNGTKLIKTSFPEIIIVILTTFKDDEYIREAVKNGAAGYILKNQPAEHIIESVRTAAKGLMVFEKSAIRVLSSVEAEKNVSNPKKADAFSVLNEREFEILKAVAKGLSNKEISTELFLSEGTIRNYITVILEKLALRDRTQLAIYYLSNV